MRSLIRSFTICLILIPLGLFPPMARSLLSNDNVTLSWNHNEEEDLSGYRVYYGLASGQYDFMEEANLDTFFTVLDLDNVTYYFAVTAYDTAGNESDFSEEVSCVPGEKVDISDDAGRSPRIPRSFDLSQNFPNPFNPSTTIRFSLAGNRGDESVHTTLKIYSWRGREIRTLVDEERPPGEYLAHWNGENSNGVRMASGTYLYRLHAGAYSSTRKMVLGK